MEGNGENGKEETHLHSNGVSKSDGPRSRAPKSNAKKAPAKKPPAKKTAAPKAAAAAEEEVDLENVESYLPTPPDGGWGWVIVFASFMSNVIVDGVAYTFGVLLPDLEETFQEPKSKISLVNSLMCGVYLFAGPIVSAMTNKFGCRPVVICGSLLATTSFALSTLSPNVSVMIFTYGVMGGLGMGMIYLPSIVSVGYYFERRRAFATGIAVCGSGVGTFIFPPFLQYLITKYDWRGAILILSGIVLQCCLCGAFMRPLEVKAVKPKVEQNPRAKNIIYKVKESTHMDDKNTTNLIRSMPDMVIKEEVQKTMLKRQQSIQDDTYVASNDSNRHEDGKDVGDSDKTSTEPKKVNKFVIRAESEEGETISEDVIVVDSSKLVSQGKKRRYQKAKAGSPHANPLLEVPGVLPGGVGGSRTNLASLTSISHLHSVQSLNLTPKDLARPMYRKDIFYSGSIYNIKELQSQTSVAGLKANVTTIPGESELVAHPSVTARFLNTCCGCLPRSARDVLGEMIDLSLFTDASFMLICLGNMTAFMGFFVPFTYLVGYALDIGISKSNANLLISAIGIANIVGRVAVGKIADNERVDSLITTYVAMAVCGVTMALCPLVSNYGLLVTLAVLFGLGVATFVSLSSIVICDRLGLEKLTNGFGLLTMARGVSSMMGLPFAGFLYDSSNSYNLSFMIAGSLLVAGAVCHAFLHLPCLRPETSSATNRPMDETEIIDMEEVEEEEETGEGDKGGKGAERGQEFAPLMGSKPEIIGVKDIPDV